METEYLSDEHPECVEAAEKISKFCYEAKIRAPVAAVALSMILDQLKELLQFEKVPISDVPESALESALGKAQVH